MEIVVGKYLGFCNGVNYTVTRTMKELENRDSLYSLGDVVHNEIVIEELKKNGLVVKNNINEIPDNSEVIIRAHGESLNTYKIAKEKNLQIIDLTCGKVKLIHNKILNHQDDNFIIIIGKKNHPETIAHKSYSNHSVVIENKNDIKDAYQLFLTSSFKSVYVVAQTTFNEDLFNELVDEIKKTFKEEIIVDNTICNATNLRQEEVVEIASKVNKMIVIGGVNSSNTKELFNIANKYCQDVYLIQTKDDLDKDIFNEDDIVGVTAGASTPNISIADVIDYLKNRYKKTKKM